VTFDLAALGRPGDERSCEVDDEALEAYAAATDDVAGGPVFAIVPVWETIAAASRSVASEEARKRAVHYEQDILLHRPIVAGVRLRSRATPVSLLARPNGTSLVIHTETRADDGTLVDEQYVTEVFRGLQADRSVGERAPDHRLEADGDPLGRSR
jgi:hypothetical protein